ncbi:M66 family metalloprotease [Providencia rettgeri]
MIVKKPIIQNIINQNTYNSLTSHYSTNLVNNIYEIFHILNNENNESNLEMILHADKTSNPLINLDRNDEKSSNEIKPDKAIYFNKNKFINPLTHKEISDTSGELKGSVYFAQNSIIPAVNRIEGDIQPKLVSGRKTLVMFKPQSSIQQNENIKLNIYDENNKLVTSENLSPPTKLPKIVDNSTIETNLLPHHFKPPKRFDIFIENENNLNIIVSNQKALHYLILKNKIIHLTFNHKYMKETFTLNNDMRYKGKTIVLENIHKKDINISYGNETVTLPKGLTIQFICDNNGRWLTEENVNLIEYWKSPDISARNLPPFFDSEIEGLPDIDVSEIDANFMNDILNEHSTIKITKVDYDTTNSLMLKSNINHVYKQILFTSTSDEMTLIHTKYKCVELKKGDLYLFKCDTNGDWENIPITREIPPLDYSQPENYDLTLDNNKSINESSENKKNLLELLKNNESIKIATSDGNWARDFTLMADNDLHNKKILFSSSAYYDSHIHYGNKSLKLGTGESVLFIYDLHKKWFPIYLNNEPYIAKNDDSTSNLEYIENTWSTTISEEYIHPDIKLEFVLKEQKGTLSNIDIGAPNELLVNTLDIGLLTPPRDVLLFQEKPELNRQYYQTIPVKNFIVSRYEPIHLTKVVMPNGQVFTDKATGKGGAYSGNMRESITKRFYADGINLANYGVNSSASDAESFNPTSQITAYNSVGVYENGRVIHGWSGGGGKATLNRTDSNELSHEFGHNFGLSDYYGGTEGGTHATADKKNSTWLWDPYNNYFIPNTYQDGSLNHDAMSGGEAYNPKYNAYTAYTPNSLVAIQKKLESNYTFSSESSTGYKKWDPNIKKLVDAKLDLSNFNIINFSPKNGSDITTDRINELLKKSNLVYLCQGNGYYAPNISLPAASEHNKNSIIKIKSYAQWNSKIHVNNKVETITKNDLFCYRSDGVSWKRISEPESAIHKKARKQGVEVVTLMGFYDPEGTIDSYIYPPSFGSYGMVYQNDARVNTDSPYLEVIFNDGNKKQYQLNNFRGNKDMMNKFHINIEHGLIPIETKLYINNKMVHSRPIEIKENRFLTTINGTIVE